MIAETPPDGSPEKEAKKAVGQPETTFPGLRLRKILVPTDFSSHAAGALNYAESLAANFGAQLVLFHVFQMPILVYGPVLSEALTAAAEADRVDCQRRLDDLCAGVHRKGRVQIEAVLGEGAAHREICALAVEIGADLIVIATHGYSGLEYMLHLGSVAERVTRHAPCPVLVVRKQARDLTELTKS